MGIGMTVYDEPLCPCCGTKNPARQKEQLADLRAQLEECRGAYASMAEESRELESTLLIENWRLRKALQALYERHQWSTSAETLVEVLEHARQVLDSTPLTAAEVERVKRLETFKEQAAKAVDGCDWIGVRSQCPFYAVLAEGGCDG